jgi:kynurenine formamidase
MKRKRFVDLGLSIESGLPSDPPMMIPRIDYLDHTKGAEGMKDFFPGVTPEQLPGGMGWAVELLTLATHSGTHMDAPYHYYPTMDKGKLSLTIDQIPLDWCFGSGVVLDFRHKSDGERIRAGDIEKELKRIKYKIRPLDIVLIQTGADAAWGTPAYLTKGAGMDRESTLFLTEKGVKVVGIDAWSWDRPLPFLAKEFRDTVIWRSWRTCRRLGNLMGLRSAVFPSKSKRPVQAGSDLLRSLKKRYRRPCCIRRPDERDSRVSKS